MADSKNYRKLYNEGNEAVPDFIYDTMFSQDDAELDDIGQGELIDHQHFMGSLKTYFIDFESLTLNEIIKLIPNDTPGVFTVSPKVDGVPGSIWYKNGTPIKALSRGKRLQGYVMAKDFLKVSPKPFNWPKTSEIIDIRGEFYITKSAFNKVNELLKQTGDKTFANPRSMVSSVVNSIDPNPLIINNLKCFLHGAWGIENTGSHFDWISNHFNIFDWYKTVTKDNLIDIIKEQYNYWFKEQDEVPVDGLVIQYDNTEANDGRCNLDRIAIKQFDEANFSAETTITNIEWNISSKGEYVPLIWFNEVEINGSKVQKCSGFCYDFLERMNINIGCDVQVIMRGGVIPYINKVTNKIRGINKNIPSDSYLKPGDSIHLWCKDSNLIDKEKFVRGGCSLKWDSFGEEFWNDLWNAGYNNIFQLIKLAKDSYFTCFLLRNVIPDTIKGKERAETFVYKLCNISYKDLIIALRINGIGEKTAEELVKYFEDGEKPKQTKYIREMFENQSLIDEIQKLGNKSIKAAVNHRIGELKGYVMMSKSPSNGMNKTQFYNTFLRDYDLTTKQSEMTLLVCPEGETSNKIEYAKKHNIPIKYYTDFQIEISDIIDKEINPNIPEDFI